MIGEWVKRFSSDIKWHIDRRNSWLWIEIQKLIKGMQGRLELWVFQQSFFSIGLFFHKILLQKQFTSP